MVQHMLTTNDNPFNPFDNFDAWWQFDIEKGYDSCSKLDRVIVVHDNFSEIEVNEAKEKAIDQIIKYDFTDTYKKISREFPDPEDSDELEEPEELKTD